MDNAAAKGPYETERTFWVTALSNIDDAIKKGDYILIDPDRAPVAGRRMLIGGSLEIWDGQAAVDISGAACPTSSGVRNRVPWAK